MTQRILRAFGILAAICGAIPAAAQTAEQPLPFAGAQTVDAGDLAKAIGSADLSMVIAANNSSTVSGNSVTGAVETGGISFDQASLSNLAGLSVLSANTGNNVAINSSLNLNVAIRP